MTLWPLGCVIGIVIMLFSVDEVGTMLWWWFSGLAVLIFSLTQRWIKD